MKWLSNIYIYNYLITGDEPEGFTKENIVLTNIIRSNGKITFNAFLNKFIDDNGVVQENNKFIPVNITFTGFKILKPTNITSGNINLPGQSNNLSSAYTDEMIKQYVFDNLITGDIPKEFSKDNIILSNIIKLNGKITFIVSLNMFINIDGQESTTGFMAKSIIFSGFKFSNRTDIKEGLHNLPHVSNITINNYNDEMIKTYISDNLITGNKPEGFTNKNIILESVDKSNNGIIKLIVSLNKYFDTNGEIQTSGFGQIYIELTGFKVLVKTDIKGGNINLPDQSNNLSSSYTDEMIKSYIFNNLITGDRPEVFTQENIVLSNIIRYSKEISLRVSLNKYINFEGQEEETRFKAVNIIFTGFKTPSPTVIENGDIIPNNANNYFAIDYTDATIKQYIFDNLITGDRPVGFTKENIILSNVINLPKKITFRASLNKFINTEGENKVDGFIFVNISFTGFKILKPTNIIDGPIVLKNQSSNLSINYTNEMIKTHIFDNLITGDRPKGFTKENIVLSHINWSNGKITFDASLNKYINTDGEEEINGFNLVEITFTGFKVLMTTNIKSGDIEPNNANNYFAIDYTDAMIKQYIFDNLIIGDKPEGFSKNNIILTKIMRGDGKITFNAYLNKYINTEVIDTEIGFTNVKIIFIGFLEDIIPEIKINNMPIIIGSVAGGGTCILLIIVGLILFKVKKNKLIKINYDENEQYYENENENEQYYENENEQYYENENENEQYYENENEQYYENENEEYYENENEQYYENENENKQYYENENEQYYENEEPTNE